MLEMILGNRVKWVEMNWNETLERQMFATSSSMRAEDLTAWNLLPARWTMGKSLLIRLHSNTFQTLQRQPDLKSSRRLKHPRLLWELIRAPIRFLSLDPLQAEECWRLISASLVRVWDRTCLRQQPHMFCVILVCLSMVCFAFSEWRLVSTRSMPRRLLPPMFLCKWLPLVESKAM